jgi:sporulation protein YlmC with PRC-barrel domain
MRTISRSCLVLLAALHALPAAAQGTGDIASAAGSAVDALASSAKDKLLVKDMLGAEVKGPDGKTIGTVENLVVLPGGRIVAAIVATDAKDTGRIPVPFSAVKIARAGGKLGFELPVGLSELKGMKEVQALAGAVPGLD